MARSRPAHGRARCPRGRHPAATPALGQPAKAPRADRYPWSGRSRSVVVVDPNPEPSSGPEAVIDKPNSSVAPSPTSPLGETKISQVIALLERPGGATLAELVAATGWLPHATRAALTASHGLNYARRRPLSLSTDSLLDGPSMWTSSASNASAVVEQIPDIPSLTLSISLKPASSKTRPAQSGPDRRASTHDVPEQARPVVFDHQNDRPLVDAEVIGANPPSCVIVFDYVGLIERGFEAVKTRHAEVHLPEVSYRRNDYLGRERQ